MDYLLVHHRVKDFDKWKVAYDAHSGERQKAELKELQLLHTKGDENDVTLLFEAKNPQKAKAFAESDNLKQIMKDAGVQGAPELSFLKD
jgi:hypothetical protein